MNVLLIRALDFPNGGATTAHASLIVKGLRKNGVNSKLVIPHGSYNGKASKRYIGHLNGIQYIFMNKIEANCASPIKKFFARRGIINSAVLIYKLKKKNKLDAVIIGTPNLIKHFPIVFMCLITRVPFFPWVVEKMSLNLDFKGVKGKFNYISEKITERYLHVFATGIIVISSFLVKHYSRYISSNKIMISPILVNPISNNFESSNEFYQGLQKKYKGNRIIIYSGTFGGKDGVHYLIDAFAIIEKKKSDIHFIMTGKSGSKKIMGKVKQHIRSLSLQKKIELVGFVSREELICYHQIGDILLVCRTNSKYANYGFPWKLGEYCMTGRPVLASKIGDIEKYYEDRQNIFLTEPEAPTQIADNIMLILKDYNNSLEVAKKGKEVAVTSFNYLNETKRILDFIKTNL